MSRTKKCAPKILAYRVVIEADPQGGFVATVPALPGCVTDGDTYEETLYYIQEAITGYLEALQKLGEPIPTEPELPAGYPQSQLISVPFHEGT